MKPLRNRSVPASPGPARWGPWVFQPENLALVHPEAEYEIDLAGIRSSAAILDWIFQLLAKGWADARTMYYLLHAFNDILKPQRHYCSWSAEIRTDGGKLAWTFAEQQLVNDIGAEMVPHERNDWTDPVRCHLPAPYRRRVHQRFAWRSAWLNCSCSGQ